MVVRRRSNSVSLMEMSEGRRTRVRLLDGRDLDILVQPRLEVSELAAIVASHVGLRPPDADLAGLVFLDDAGRAHWLSLDRRVLDHEFPRKMAAPPATLLLFHTIKFFPESMTQLKNATTIELLFLQVRQHIAKGSLVVEEEGLAEMGALLLHLALGDYRDEATAEAALRLVMDSFKAQPLPPSPERVLDEYKVLSGLSKGHAVLRFMRIAEASPSYGMHFYSVKDKTGLDWTLGISTRGILQFQHGQAPRKPKRVFQWKQLENLYYRDKKFSIEVHDPRRVVHELSRRNLYEEALEEEPDDALASAVSEPSTQVSVSRRAFVSSSVQVLVFFCDTAAQCKTIWGVAIAQHQFYLDRKSAARKTTEPTGGRAPTDPARLEGMAAALTAQLQRRSPEDALRCPVLSPSISSPSLDSGNGSSEKSEEERAKELELYRTLQARKAALETALAAKLAELKAACLQEGTITGELPPETKSSLAPGESMPRIQRRVGTKFPVPGDLLSGNRVDALASLEADIEIQRRICAAASRLSSDKSTNKSVRRKRQRDSQAAASRLKEMEKRLATLRLSASKPDLTDSGYSSKSQSRNCRAWPNFSGRAANGSSTGAASCPATPRGSLPDIPGGLEDDEGLDLDDVPMPGEGRPPPGPSPLRCMSQQPSAASLEGSPSLSSLPIYENIGYKNSLYQSSYRKKQYPTLAPGKEGGPLTRVTHLHRTHSEHSLASLPASDIQPLPDFRTYGSESAHHSVGAYNIPHQRTSWNLPALDLGLHSVTSSDSIAPTLPSDSRTSSSSSCRYGFARNRQTEGKASPAKSGSPKATNALPPAPPPNTTSLDRRVLRGRPPRTHKVGGWDAVPPTNPSPKRVPLHPSPLQSSSQLPLSAISPPPNSLQIQSAGTEMVKPYQTADVLKYSRRGREAGSPTSPPGPGPQSPRGRPPPPPYPLASRSTPTTSPPPHNGLGSMKGAVREELLSWYDEKGHKHKTATIV